MRFAVLCGWLPNRLICDWNSSISNCKFTEKTWTHHMIHSCTTVGIAFRRRNELRSILQQTIVLASGQPYKHTSILARHTHGRSRRLCDVGHYCLVPAQLAVWLSRPFHSFSILLGSTARTTPFLEYSEPTRTKKDSKGIRSQRHNVSGLLCNRNTESTFHRLHIPERPPQHTTTARQAVSTMSTEINHNSAKCGDKHQDSN